MSYVAGKVSGQELEDVVSQLLLGPWEVRSVLAQIPGPGWYLGHAHGATAYCQNAVSARKTNHAERTDIVLCFKGCTRAANGWHARYWEALNTSKSPEVGQTGSDFWVPRALVLRFRKPEVT